MQNLAWAFVVWFYLLRFVLRRFRLQARMEKFFIFLNILLRIIKFMILKQKFLKKINGKNFYASKSKYPISNLTMIHNNPKSGNKNLSKLEILTPDTSKEEIITAFSTLGTVSSDTQAVPSSFIPFIVTAYAQNTNATNNKLILENGELSSVYFCKPSIGDCGVPNNSQKGDRFKYLITAAFTDRRGGGFNNQTILKENSYINNGCRKYLHLALKWSSLYFRICSF
nr:putative periplasmic protein [Campylobacter jejuni subsp. jejuni CG8421]